MADFNQQLQSLLSNPALMQQLSSMAGAMGIPAPGVQTPGASAAQTAFDPAMLAQVAAMMQQTRLEPRQQELLRALEPYLPGDRLQKLHRAMQAAKLAGAVSAAAGQTGR